MKDIRNIAHTVVILALVQAFGLILAGPIA